MSLLSCEQGMRRTLAPVTEQDLFCSGTHHSSGVVVNDAEGKLKARLIAVKGYDVPRNHLARRLERRAVDTSRVRHVQICQNPRILLERKLGMLAGEGVVREF